MSVKYQEKEAKEVRNIEILTGLCVIEGVLLVIYMMIYYGTMFSL